MVSDHEVALLIGRRPVAGNVWIVLLLFACASLATGCHQQSSSEKTATSESLVPAESAGRLLTTYAFDCEGDYVVAHFPDEPGEGGTEEMVLFLPDKTLLLSHVPSGSGAKYSNGSVTFWMKGYDEALLEIADCTTKHCDGDRKKSLVEDAKLRGVDFRALGNEPGWVLEIGPDAIVFEYDYGAKRTRFPLPVPQVDTAKRRTVYAVRAEAHDLSIVLEGKECHDSMSGDGFEVTVTVTLDGREFRGCGHALH